MLSQELSTTNNHREPHWLPPVALPAVPMIPIKNCLRSNDGNVAIIFATTLPLLVGLLGIGLDLAQAAKQRTVLVDTLNSTSGLIASSHIVCPNISASHGRSFVAQRDITDCTLRDAPGETVISFAKKAVSSHFSKMGYNEAPVLDPRIHFNTATNRVALSGTTSHSCILAQVLISSCRIGIRESVGDAGMPESTSTNTIRLVVPDTRDIWLGETGSPALPTRITVAGGVAPYEFAVGPRLPKGLTMDPKSGTINGSPEAEQCYGWCPPEFRSIAVSAQDAGASQKRNSASASVQYRIIHKLKVSVDQIPSSGFAFSVRPSGGEPPFRYSCSNLPEGMYCDPNTGQIAGYPTRQTADAGGRFTVRVTDARGKSAQTTANYSSPGRASNLNRNNRTLRQ